ncbi:sugar phosphate isomerase/epimerase family protein [Paenibacillus mendelii]|uniref:Sugar phosphate isomerase/epimerase family protein n=1 Tax=Paenibacillus mendelii TaxID=206163 RepID=A0ABV6JFA4_9BACL|nr:sugar phosphate isomerase/epimerase [Paenibacillus mendelii]MCQ6557474.1 sugar phosphate isomerase/epimerase [Paenibacillus mendelii]
MRVGIDSFTIRDLKLDAYQTLDYVKKLGLEGVLFGDMAELSREADVGRLIDIREYAEMLGMYVYSGVGTCNPVLVNGSLEEHKETLVEHIQAYAEAGWHELRSVICYSDENYNHPVPWKTHLNQSIDFIQSLRPVLEKCGSRINLENHGDGTFDLVRVVEAVGADICGICLDTANMLVCGEDPVLAAKRVAPYTHLTHTKDGIIYFSDNGVMRQGKAPGQGIVDFEQIIPILGEYSPHLPLSIEDHKWLFEVSIFDPAWIDKNPDLTPVELGQFVKLAWQTEKKLASGEFPNVEEYEAIPYLDQMEERLTFGYQHLKEIINKQNL